MADEANLEQVIINLVVNARDAMPDGGRIDVRVAPVCVTEEAAAQHPNGHAGNFVHIMVGDTGLGMEPEVMAHIFEPFFTTKGQGKGTGLGLSTVYAIVRQHSGWIEVSSHPGRGTCFDIFLPALHKDTPPAPEPNGETAARMPAFDGRGERVLLVEDEPSVRMAVRAIVSRAGYAVTEAVDGSNALQLWSTAVRPFDLLITDIVMPNGMNGVELATELRSRNPRLKVIISTGYSQDLLRRNGQMIPGTKLLLKPFTTESILKTIREVLDAPA
jgi:CheY-like chemotaxis protein